jgi:hypothetical protein
MALAPMALREAAMLIPDVELKVFEGLGAPVYRDDPETVASFVEGFLEGRLTNYTASS